MSRIQMLPHLFLFVGVFMLTAPYSVLSEEIEHPSVDDSACDKIIQEAEESFQKCMRPLISPADLMEARRRYNGSLCPECFLMCREQYNFKECVKTNVRTLYPCYMRIRHIPQSFFMDLLESMIDYACANDSAIMSDLLTPNVKGCEKKTEVCEDKRMRYFFKKGPESSNDTLPEGVEFTEKAFCSIIEQTIDCAAIELQGCSDSDTITRTFHSLGDHFKSTASCGKFYNGVINEENVEDNDN